MRKVSCIIVEDEPASQEILNRYVRDFPSLELKAICANAIEANEFLHRSRIDLMFLDVNMPRLSGLDFYKALADPPAVIFTTAYPEYAVNAFDVSAVDYLVKPFPFERFVKAMNRFQSISQTSSDQSGYILLNADKKMHKVNFSDIRVIEAMGDYVKVHATGKTIVAHLTLQKIQDQLPKGSFARIHKSYIISIPLIEYIEGNMAIVGKDRVPIGQTYRADFIDRFQKRNLSS